jgi:hypothetical protein
MKKLLLTLTLVAATAVTMYGQGRVAFDNFSGTGLVTVDADNQGPDGGLAGQYVGADYSIQLVWAPQGTYADQAAFDAAVVGSSAPVSFYGATGGSPGTDLAGNFFGGNVPVDPVGTYTMQARAWFANGFATYAAALGGGKNTGYSGLFDLASTAAPTPANATLFGDFTVGTTIVPEPSTFALAGLGLAGLLIFRRRNK